MSDAYLNTRVSLFSPRLGTRGWAGRLIDVDDGDLPGQLEAADLGLLAHGYADDDPRSLEVRIVAILLDETRVLLRPLTGAARQFLLYWVERFEVSNVKSLLRARMAGDSVQATAARLLDLGTFSRLDVEALMRADDVAELMRRLERTVYAEIVRNARQAFEEGHDPFILDATLDRAYFDGMIRRARGLEASLGAGFRSLIASLVDRTALVWLLRYRFNYGLPPAQVYYLLPGPGYRLDPSRLRALVALDSIEAVTAALPEPLKGWARGSGGVPEFANRLERVALDEARRVLARDTQPVTRALAYLILRESGLREVRAVLRGRRLGLPPDDIRLAVAG